jgi:hypothetical protein
MDPIVIEGNSYTDARGLLMYNNDFDTSLVKRIYTIENFSNQYIRGWQGHKIEQRWLTVIKGSFKIQTIKIENWDCPDIHAKKCSFIINDTQMDVLNIPKGYVSAIQSLALGSKLLVMSDYRINEVNDEYRFSLDYFVE